MTEARVATTPCPHVGAGDELLLIVAGGGLPGPGAAPAGRLRGDGPARGLGDARQRQRRADAPPGRARAPAQRAAARWRLPRGGCRCGLASTITGLAERCWWWEALASAAGPVDPAAQGRARSELCVVARASFAARVRCTTCAPREPVAATATSRLRVRSAGDDGPSCVDVRPAPRRRPASPKRTPPAEARGAGGAVGKRRDPDGERSAVRRRKPDFATALESAERAVRARASRSSPRRPAQGARTGRSAPAAGWSSDASASRWPPPGGRRQTAQAGSRGTRSSRHCIASASSSSRRPASDLADAGDQLQRLGGLRRADDADERREHAHRRAARLLELLAFAEQAVIARARRVARVEHRDLPVEADRGAPRPAACRAATQARFTACRVAKLSQQSSTTSAAATSGASRSRVDALGDRSIRDVRIDRRERAAPRRRPCGSPMSAVA